ncbi:MAG: hypothetical protein ACE14P_14245, partial [Methanotrichaceae archaeon]
LHVVATASIHPAITTTAVFVVIAAQRQRHASAEYAHRHDVRKAPLIAMALQEMAVRQIS